MIWLERTDLERSMTFFEKTLGLAPQFGDKDFGYEPTASKSGGRALDDRHMALCIEYLHLYPRRGPHRPRAEDPGSEIAWQEALGITEPQQVAVCLPHHRG